MAVTLACASVTFAIGSSSAPANAIPLGQYVNGGAQAVVTLFALVGLFRLVLALESLLVLVRYRAMIPLMFLVWLSLHVGSKALSMAYPIPSSGVSSAHTASVFVYAILGMLVLGFVLSSWWRLWLWPT